MKTLPDFVMNLSTGNQQLAVRLVHYPLWLSTIINAPLQGWFRSMDPGWFGLFEEFVDGGLVAAGIEPDVVPDRDHGIESRVGLFVRLLVHGGD